jgi:hypothetical protein
MSAASRPGISVLVPFAAIGVALLAVTWAPAAEAAAARASLSLVPSAGQPGSFVVADFRLVGSNAGGCAGTVEFTWDATLMGAAQLSRGVFGGCDAVLEFAVPASASDGAHTVAAAAVAGSGYAAASAEFMVGSGASTSTTVPPTTTTSSTTQVVAGTTTTTTTTPPTTTTTTSWTPPPYTPASQRPVSMPTSPVISAAAANIPQARVSARQAAFGFAGFVGLVGIVLLTFAAVHISQARRTRR